LYPDRLEHCQRVLAVPSKRARQRTVEYLEYDEIQAILAAVDRATYSIPALPGNSTNRPEDKPAIATERCMSTIISAATERPHRATVDGRRDYALLVAMFNTGASARDPGCPPA